MAQVLLIRLDAPLMSFGGPIADNYGYTEDYPALSMVTGLLANALGYRHGEFDRLERLQSRLRMAARCDQPGESLLDFQTVNLGQDFLLDECAWTTRHKIEKRRGDYKNSRGTHIRYRHYLSDSIYTLAIGLDPEVESPTLPEIAGALQTPMRPLFIGRKCCIPASPLFLALTEATSLLDALKIFPGFRKAVPSCPNENYLRPGGMHRQKMYPRESRLVAVSDERDWANQVHTGRRFIYHGSIDPPEQKYDHKS